MGGSDPDLDLLTGYIEAELVYVGAPASGWLVSTAVSEGDVVTIGDPLFELESDLQDAQLREATDRLRQARAQARDLSTGAREPEIDALESQLAEATAGLELAALERQRLTTLARDGIVPRDTADRAITEHERAAATVEALRANIQVARLAGREAAREAAQASAAAAEAAVTQASWHRSQRRVDARVDGRVEEIFHRPGELVAGGSPVLAILPSESLEVRFFVPQADLSRVTPGIVVDVLSDGALSPAAARVTYVAREAEFTPPVIYSTGSRDKLVFLVRARVDDASTLRPGQPVDVRLP